jgi:predicted RNA-binding protein with RPS1 domain
LFEKAKQKELDFEQAKNQLRIKSEQEEEEKEEKAKKAKTEEIKKIMNQVEQQIETQKDKFCSWIETTHIRELLWDIRTNKLRTQ